MVKAISQERLIPRRRKIDPTLHDLMDGTDEPLAGGVFQHAAGRSGRQLGVGAHGQDDDLFTGVG
jgi:hypothetical protein